MSGFQMQGPVFLLMQPMAIGLTRMKGGPGFQIIHGDGRHFIMAGGLMIRCTVLCGCLITNGGRDGLRGEDRKVITDGLPSDQVSVSALHMEMDIIYLATNGDL